MSPIIEQSRVDNILVINDDAMQDGRDWLSRIQFPDESISRRMRQPISNSATGPMQRY